MYYDTLKVKSFGELKEFSCKQSIPENVLVHFNQFKKMEEMKVVTYFDGKFDMKELDLKRLELSQHSVAFPLYHLAHFSRLETLKLKKISNYIDKKGFMNKLKFFNSLKELEISFERKSNEYENNISVPHPLALNLHKFTNLKVFKGLITPKYEQQYNDLNLIFQQTNPSPLEEIEALKFPCGDKSIDYFFGQKNSQKKFPKLKCFATNSKIFPYIDRKSLLSKDLFFPSSLECLIYKGFLNFSHFENLTNLQVLSLKVPQEIYSKFSYQFFSNLKKLKFFRFNYYYLQQHYKEVEWSFLKEMKSLQYLNLEGTELDDKGIIEISNLQFLSHLYISNCNLITDISPLSLLPRLQVLESTDLPRLKIIFDSSPSLTIWKSGFLPPKFINSSLYLPHLSSFSLFYDQDFSLQSFNAFFSLPSLKNVHFESLF